MKNKYIIFAGEKMVIFPESIVHADMAAMCQSLGAPTSAGFIEIENTYSGCSCKCLGESVSLQLKAADGDTAIAQKMLGLD